MKQVEISIVIPALDEEKLIGGTIESIQRSEFSGTYEIIVVCNGCTDNTAKISEGMGATVFSLSDKGAPEAMNYGASKASGHIIVFLDADTTISSNLLSDTLHAWRSEYVGGRTVVKWSGDSFPARMSWIISHVHKYKWGGFCFVDKNLFDEVEGYRIGAKYGFDFDLARRVSKGRNVAFLKSSHVLTSDRRYSEEGWWKHFWLAIKRYYIDEVLFGRGLKGETQIDYSDRR